jgi:hypothetical protein
MPSKDGKTIAIEVNGRESIFAPAKESIAIGLSLGWPSPAHFHEACHLERNALLS